jgi:alpha-beta hydrolase superfamily lysophospholipase
MDTTIETAAVTSNDGTRIEFDRSGEGPAVVIIGAGPTDRSANTPVAELLAAHFAVYNYDRRARGGSGDTHPYTVDREYEDLAAVIDATGSSVLVYGTSGGAVIALEAAARDLPITKLGLWEPPFVLDDEPIRPPADYQAQLTAALAAGRPGDAVELFFTLAVGMPTEMVTPMRDLPFWSAMESTAQGLVYDAAQLGDFRPRPDRLSQVAIPALVLDGGTVPWMSRTADAIAPLLARGDRRTLAGQPHNVDARTIAPVLTEFFAA